jgi:hypothetical protein
MNPEPVLHVIADAILDGMPVDWSVIDSNATMDATCDNALVDQLKTLETLRRRSRASAAPEVPGAWTWGHLRVLERIGKGAYGDVYRAWDTRLDREVALKLLPSDAPSVDPSHSTIIEEGRLLARVRHPNVVTIYGAERIDGRVGLWMEAARRSPRRKPRNWVSPCATPYRRSTLPACCTATSRRRTSCSMLRGGWC